ncbi:MAG: hypothetical protein ACK6DE_19505 [Pseudanabaena sp.]
MNIRKELLDELLQECKTTPDLFGEGGILKRIGRESLRNRTINPSRLRKA